jgi:spore coat protein U-like protein
MNAKKLKLAVLASAAALSLGFGSGATAGNATANLTVTATVPQTCTIATGAVNFGSYDPTGAQATADLPGSGTVLVTCTNGAGNTSNGATAITLTLDDGQHFSATRRMEAGATANYLGYELYQPLTTTAGAACGALTQRWGTTGAEIFTPAPANWDGTQKTFNVCGNVPQAQNVPPGTYNDTVVATVNF